MNLFFRKTACVLVCLLAGLLCQNHDISVFELVNAAENVETQNPGADQLPPFPTVGIMPKQETGALQFLEKHPDYDGRGTIVAIFDTGVDPGAIGLQTTSDGKPKVIDMIDGTGSGDVETTTVKKSANGELEGLTGRKLKVDPKWKNPSGEYHLGIKRAFDLYPGAIIPRLKSERKKQWNKTQQAAELALRRSIQNFSSQKKNNSEKSKPSKKELETRLQQLVAAGKSMADPGPIFDCVVFHDGKHWRAVIDTDEDGDLAEEKTMTNFRTERQFATFGSTDLLNFSVNIYDSGNLLSIVTDAGMHGTHVAGIVSGYYPDEPAKNGIAPGAQIVSVKIGDTRLGSMETGPGLERGLKAVLDNGCDLINMSYGEPSSVPNGGRLIDLFSQTVNKHGVIFVASAGNSGPALSTVGAPGGTTTAIIGVGAYVSPEMMQAEYALRENLPGMAYTWSSRGPTFDGDLGVDIFAPGGAIAAVPNWGLRSSQQMNGTSMSSPNACGNVALLLSGLKAEKIAYSPASIKRSLKNTAKPVAGTDVFAQGPGLLQVDAAWSALTANKTATGELLRFAISVAGKRGIYLRSAQESNHRHLTRVSVRPVNPEGTTSETKLNFEMPVTLQPTVDWVQAGTHLVLTSAGNAFEISIDPTGLEPGAHYAEVLGFDSAAPQRGPIFRVPITVVRSEAANDDSHSTLSGNVEFQPGSVVRKFVAVPQSATWADLKLKLSDDTAAARRILVHAVQKLNGLSFEEAEWKQYVSLRPGSQVLRSFPVVGGETLELCLAQYWSSLGSSELEFELKFHALQPSSRTVTVPATGKPVRVRVNSPLGKETVAVAAQLKRRSSQIRPMKSEIKLLSPERDRLPNEQSTSQLTLTYEFTLSKSESVTIRFSKSDGLLYDSTHSGHLWMLYDENNRRVATQDVYPKPVRLVKGKYKLKLQIRHSSVAELEKYKLLEFSLERPLSRAISLSAYSTREAALKRSSTLGTRTLKKGEHADFYLVAPTKLPAEVSSGDMLLGTISYGKASDLEPSAGKRPGGFLLQLAVPAVGVSSSKPSVPGKISSEQKLKDEIFKLRVEQLKRIDFEKNRELFDKQAAEILKERPNHLPVLLAKLHHLDSLDHRKERLSEVVAAADIVLKQIDAAEIQKNFGTNVNSADSAAVKLRKKLSGQRDILIDTLYRKGRALGYMELPDVLAKHPIADSAAHEKLFEGNFSQLQKWVNTTDQKYVLLHIRRERRRGNYGESLKLLEKNISSSGSNFWLFKKRRDIYEKLGWQHLWEYERRWLMIRFPAQTKFF